MSLSGLFRLYSSMVLNTSVLSIFFLIQLFFFPQKHILFTKAHGKTNISTKHEISGLQSSFVVGNLGLWSCRTWIVCLSQNIGIRAGQIFFFYLFFFIRAELVI